MYKITQDIYENSKGIADQIPGASEKVEEKKKLLWSKAEKKKPTDKNTMWDKTQVIKALEPNKRVGVEGDKNLYT